MYPTFSSGHRSEKLLVVRVEELHNRDFLEAQTALEVYRRSQHTSYVVRCKTQDDVKF